jgi:hypothetical protein
MGAGPDRLCHLHEWLICKAGFKRALSLDRLTDRLIDAFDPGGRVLESSVKWLPLICPLSLAQAARLKLIFDCFSLGHCLSLICRLACHSADKL